MNSERLDSLTLHARAKLNLVLKVIGRRADGYHRLSMLNVPLTLCDEISIERNRSPGVSLGGVHLDHKKMQPGFESKRKQFQAELSDAEKNIALRAAHAFFKHFGIKEGVTISIEKRIPAGTGLGGGSSDAAAVLRGLRAMFLPSMDEELSAKMVSELGASLGADVPFFLLRGAALVQGIGEVVVPLPGNAQEELNGYSVVVVIPDYEMPTARVYARFRELNPDLRELSVDAVSDTSALSETKISSRFKVSNDLEPSIVSLAPELGDLLASLRGVRASQASFTGSGSAIFLLPEGGAGEKRLESEVLDIVRGSKIPCRVFTEQIITL